MTKTQLASVVALLLIGLKLTTGVEVGDEEQNQIVELVMTAVTTGTLLYGIGKALFKKKG